MVALRYLLRNDYDGLKKDKNCTLLKDVIFDEESKTLCRDHNLSFNKDELNLQRHIRLAEEWIQEHGVLILSKNMSKSLYAVLSMFDKQPQPLKDAMWMLGYDNTRKAKDQNQVMVDRWEEYLNDGEQFDDYFHEVVALSKMMPVSKMIPPEPHLDDENYDSAIALHKFAKHALSETSPLTKLACCVRKVPERVSRVLSIQPKTRVIEYGVAEKAYIRAILKTFQSTRDILEEKGCQITILGNKYMKTNFRRPDLQIIAECPVRVASLDTDDTVEEESHNEYYTIYVDVEIDEGSHSRYAIKDEQIRFSNVHFGAVEEFEAMSRTTIHCNVGDLKQANPDQVDTIVQVLKCIFNSQIDLQEDDLSTVSIGDGDNVVYIDYKPSHKHVINTMKRIHDSQLQKSIVPGGADWENTLFDSVTTILTPAYGSKVHIRENSCRELRINSYTTNAKGKANTSEESEDEEFDESDEK